jgi:hypothetical protein
MIENIFRLLKLILLFSKAITTYLTFAILPAPSTTLEPQQIYVLPPAPAINTVTPMIDCVKAATLRA